MRVAFGEIQIPNVHGIHAAPKHVSPNTILDYKHGALFFALLTRLPPYMHANIQSKFVSLFISAETMIKTWIAGTMSCGQITPR